MKISLRWLNDYVDVQDFFENPEKLAAKLTAAGIEVEHVENLAEKFASVVVGHVVEKGQHPNADRLSLCQVDVGSGETLQIVCGAQNHKQGDKVVVAKVGAVLPGNFEIKKSKIRQVESFGMMCSEKELDLAEDSPGIMILPGDAPVGTPFAEYMGWNDVVMELSVTPNRADCLSHFGLAREVAALLGRGYEMPLADIKATDGSTKKLVDLQVKNGDLCPRYAGRGIFGVKVGPSPDWLKKRLESVGLNSINNVVDVTNFVMMELGQPLHAFDADEIAGKTIIVDNAKKGEVFQSLDGTEFKLDGDELMIRDGERPVALAGVVGGLNSGVTEKTQNIFLESAYFLRETVRRTSRKLGIDTDSGYRFSRGTDPEGVVLAMNRACELIQKVAGGDVAKDHHDFYPNPFSHPTITISHEYLETRLGYKAEGSEFETWMKRLGCQVKANKKAAGWDVQPPPYRVDLEANVDLVEEFARLNGYENVPENFPPLVSSPSTHAFQFIMENRVNDLMVAEGYLQAVNYGFYASRAASEFLGDTTKLKNVGLNTAEKAVSIRNPLSEDTDVMRTSLLPGLFKNLLHNYRHGMESGRLFENGFVFNKGSEGYEEECRLGLAVWGHSVDMWAKDKARPVVYDLKASVENLMAKLMITGYQWRKLKSAEEYPSFVHPGQAVGLFVEGRLLGVLGTLHPSLAQENKLRHDCALGEFSFDGLMRGQPRTAKARPLSKFPAVERDLAFLVPESVAAEDLLKEIRKQSGNLLEDAWIFDVYAGDKLEKGMRSIAYKMIFRDQNGTLGEAELTDLQKKLVQSVEKRFNVQVR
ncbi:MAG: phenylalanine--tRNA ligase subunit beta [Bdellovibrionales bacterium]|nr:phenylalanine--tRNA ligase subunit beta [Bdellovibrionales bacterium]